MSKEFLNVVKDLNQQAVRLAELEEKLNSHIEAMSELRLNHRMCVIEERLDKLEPGTRIFEDLVDAELTEQKKRLDKLEDIVEVLISLIKFEKPEARG